MSQQKSKNYLNLEHEKEYLFEISQTTSYCSNCSTVIITDKSGKHISTIKPKKCNIHQEFPLPTYFNKRNTKKIYSFSNDKDYIKIRANFVKNMKKNCKKLNLNLKTFFILTKFVPYSFLLMKQHLNKFPIYALYFRLN